VSRSGPDAGVETRVAGAVAAIRARTALVPRVGFTLGSGLGGVIDALDDAVTFDTAALPHWPRSTVPGHAGRLSLGRWAGLPVVALSGRSHVYEGYPLDRVTLAVRVMRALGATALVFTNAVGGIARELAPGDLVLLSDHVNFIGTRGLFPPAELAARGAARRTAAHHSPRLREALRAAAIAAGVTLRQGVLVAGRGPSYETAAEIRMDAALGADVVGMSTAHEVTLAAELGCEAACLSCVTNMATGISTAALSHAEVAEVALEAAARLRAVLEAFVRAEARSV
jgi:purine-nucleoside phosphorylase